MTRFGRVARRDVDLDNKTAVNTIVNCIGESIANHFGLETATAVSGIGAIPIPKEWVPPYRAIGSSTTNIISVIGYFIDVTVPRVLIDGIASTNLLRIVGRINPYVFAGLLALDTAIITAETYECYSNKASQAGPQSPQKGPQSVSP